MPVIYDTKGVARALFESAGDALTIGDYVGGNDVAEANLRVIEEAAADWVEAGEDADEEMTYSLEYAGHQEWNDYTQNDAWLTKQRTEERVQELVDADCIIVSGGYGYRQAFFRVTPGSRRDQERPAVGAEVARGSPWGEGVLTSLAWYPLLDDDVHSEVEEERFAEAYADLSYRDFVRDAGWPEWLFYASTENHNDDVETEVTEAVHEEARNHFVSAETWIDSRCVGSDVLEAARKKGALTRWTQLAAKSFVASLSEEVEWVSFNGMPAQTKVNLKEIIDATIEVCGVDVTTDELAEFPSLRSAEDPKTTEDWADVARSLLEWFRQEGESAWQVTLVRAIGTALVRVLPTSSDAMAAFSGVRLRENPFEYKSLSERAPVLRPARTFEDEEWERYERERGSVAPAGPRGAKPLPPLDPEVDARERRRARDRRSMPALRAAGLKTEVSSATVDRVHAFVAEHEPCGARDITLGLKMIEESTYQALKILIHEGKVSRRPRSAEERKAARLGKGKAKGGARTGPRVMYEIVRPEREPRG